MSTSKGPYTLVTVNNVPERAKKVIGRVTEELKDRYTIDYVANCPSINEVESTVKKYRPDILFCASMWTPEESTAMQDIARSIMPEIKTYAIPEGLQVQGGPDAVVEHLKAQIPLLLE